MNTDGFIHVRPYVDRPARGVLYAIGLGVAVFALAAAWAWVAAPVLSWMASGV